MYALVKFFDNVHYVCRSSHIYTNKQDITTVKYSNQCKYLATIIAKNDDEKLLQTILNNINTNKPHISCSRVHKKLANDTDKLIILHDISANNETAISKSEYDYQKNTHVSVHENITTTIKCDNESTNNDTYNINSNCPRNIPAPCVNINKTRCYDDVRTRSKNKKTNISNSDSNCQRNVHVPASCDNEKECSDDGSEYVPSEQSSSHNSESPQNNISNKRVSSASSFNASDINIVGTSSCNDELMYVENSKIKSTKRNCCTFCMKLQSQLARHLETVHCNEPEVKKFSVLPKKNPERKEIINTIRRMGNFKFNTKSEFNTGQLIVSRRPNEKVNKTATDFIACAKCKGFFAKSTIRHHARECFKKDFRTNKSIMVMGRKITGRIHKLANETLRNMVIPVMRDDIVTRIVRYDELLILYANKLCVEYKSQHQQDMIRARLRVLGRFLLALREINKNIDDFQSLYHPKIYDDCISAINVVAGYDNEQQLYKTPAVAANLTTLVKQIGNLLITECIKREDDKKKKSVKDFLKLLIVDVGTSVTKTVIETQLAHKRHKKINLPSLKDIQTLHTHLAKKRTGAYTALKESFSYEKWISLAEVTLTSMHVFNRRRAGEMERVLIEDFESYERLNENMYSDIYNSLSAEDKKIAQKYVRFLIRGKLGRTVPVLLSNDLFECITLILKFRKEANVPKNNPYIFGLPGLNKHRYKYLRACVLMRKFARECNASCSTTLRGTTLQKHIATHCIQLNLNDTDVTDLATFMDHADKVHREHYRRSPASRDILKISQYLEAVQNTQGISTQDTSTQDSNNESASDMELEKQTNSEEDISFNNDEIDVTISSNDISNRIDCQNQKDKNGKRKRNTSPYGKTKRVRWTEEEKETALQTFAKYMENQTLPSLKEIENIRNRCLTRRTSPQIKTWLHNMQKKKRP